MTIVQVNQQVETIVLEKTITAVDESCIVDNCIFTYIENLDSITNDTAKTE